MTLDGKKIWVAGHNGMVGSALVRALSKIDCELCYEDRLNLDLTEQKQVREFLHAKNPDYVIVAAAKVGGIHANNSYPAEFCRDNLMIASNIIHESYQKNVQRLLFLGSSCIYPRLAEQPMREASLLSGPLEQTNEAYAIAKIAGLKLCQFYRKQFGARFHSAMPTNLYGPGDNYQLENSHVLPALIRRFHEAVADNLPYVTIWGSGKSLREFLHVDDLAKGCLELLDLEDPPDWINIGAGQEISIARLAYLIAEIVGFEGKVIFDTDKPDGSPRKFVDNSLYNKILSPINYSLKEGISMTYKHFKAELKSGSLRD
jgi:GDP-L-fucose synthase